MKAAILALFLLPAAALAEADPAWTVLAEQDPQAVLSHIEITVRSGSLSDLSVLPGLAHFTARALLRGTRTRPYKDLSDALERIGGTLTVSVARTRTVFHGAVPARNLDSYLDLLRDVFTQPAFDVKEMNLLQAIVDGELRRAVQDPEVVASRAVLQEVFAGGPPEGTVEGIARIQPQDAAQFFATRYVRRNMLIGVTSPFAVEDLVARVTAKLSQVPQGTADAARLPAPALSGRRAVVVNRPGLASLPTLLVSPAAGDASHDIAALDLGNFVFGTDPASRLAAALGADHGLASGVTSGFTALLEPDSTVGLFSARAGLDFASAAGSLSLATNALDSFLATGPTETELERARDALVSQLTDRSATAPGRLEFRLREALTGRPAQNPDQLRAQLASLSSAEIAAALARSLPGRDLLLVVVGDAKTLQPALAALPGFAAPVVRDVTP